MRHCKDLQISRYRTEFAKKDFHYAAFTLWNDTPAEIRELPTLDRFKKTTKNASKDLDSQTQLPRRTAMIRFIGLQVFIRRVLSL